MPSPKAASVPLPPSRLPSPTPSSHPHSPTQPAQHPHLKRHVSAASPLRSSSVPPTRDNGGQSRDNRSIVREEDPIQNLLFSSRPASRTTSPGVSPNRISRQRPTITRSTTSTTTIVHAGSGGSVPPPSLGKRNFTGDRLRDGFTYREDPEETDEEDDFYLERCELASSLFDKASAS